MKHARAIAGLAVQVASKSDVAKRYRLSLRTREKLYLAFANTNLINCASRSSALRAALQRFYVVNDGVGMQLASLALYRRKFPENLNGTDLVPFLLSGSPPQTRVFLFGAKPESLHGAANRLGALSSVIICGSRDGYSCWSEIQVLVNEINDAEPDVVLVALGNPVQELWIARYGPQLRAPVVIGVGALFDFLSGTQKRAPRLLRRARLEWLHRLACDPKRLWRRYSLDIAQFLFFVVPSGGSHMRNLELLLGRMTLEVEILRETLDTTRSTERRHLASTSRLTEEF